MQLTNTYKELMRKTSEIKKRRTEVLAKKDKYFTYALCQSRFVERMSFSNNIQDFPSLCSKEVCISSTPATGFFFPTAEKGAISSDISVAVMERGDVCSSSTVVGMPKAEQQYIARTCNKVATSSSNGSLILNTVPASISTNKQ